MLFCIDYNQDGDFSDAGETVWTKARSKITPVTGSITIPASALLGSTRMRVSMKYNATPTACEALLTDKLRIIPSILEQVEELKKQVTPEFHSTCIQIL
jgi:hypothetical protein